MITHTLLLQRFWNTGVCQNQPWIMIETKAQDLTYSAAWSSVLFIVLFGGDTYQMLRTTALGYLLFPLSLTNGSQSFLHIKMSWELLKTLTSRPDFRPIESKSSPGIRIFYQGDYNMLPSLRTGIFYLFFLNFNGHMDFLGIFLLCRIWFSWLRWSMRFCITNKWPGGDIAAGLVSYIE